MTDTVKDENTRKSDPVWTLRDRLLKARRVAGMSQGDLAAVLDASVATIVRVESGRAPVARRTLIAIAYATGVDAEWLEHGDAA